MRITIAAIAAAALAACTTPADVRRDGARTDYTLKLAPAAAARCMARNAEDHFGTFSAQVRDGVTPAAGATVIVRGGDSTAVIAELRPAGGGSQAAVWLSPLIFAPPGSRLPAVMAQGC